MHVIPAEADFAADLSTLMRACSFSTAGAVLTLLALHARVLAHNHYALVEDHETNAWRRAATGRPVPTVKGGSKALIWSCHERVGIGNNLGAFTHAMREALEGDRVLVITSLILHKFCEAGSSRVVGYFMPLHLQLTLCLSSSPASFRFNPNPDPNPRWLAATGGCSGITAESRGTVS